MDRNYTDSLYNIYRFNRVDLDQNSNTHTHKNHRFEILVLLFGHCRCGFDITVAFTLITFNYMIWLQWKQHIKSYHPSAGTFFTYFDSCSFFLFLHYSCGRWIFLFFFFFIHLILNGTKSIMRIYLSKSQVSSIILSSSFMRAQLHIFCRNKIAVQINVTFIVQWEQENAWENCIDYRPHILYEIQCVFYFFFEMYWSGVCFIHNPCKMQEFKERKKDK